MRTSLQNPTASFERLPLRYDSLCREVWLPRPIHDPVAYEIALAAIEPFWGREEEMNADQSDWFRLTADLVANYEEENESPSPLPMLQDRLRGLLEARGMNAADLGRLLGLDSGMGSKLLKGDRRLTAEHIRTLSREFGIPGDYFLID